MIGSPAWSGSTLGRFFKTPISHFILKVSFPKVPDPLGVAVRHGGEGGLKLGDVIAGIRVDGVRIEEFVAERFKLSMFTCCKPKL